MSTVTSVTKAGDYVLSERFVLTSYRKHPDTSEPVSIDVRQLVSEIQIYENKKQSGQQIKNTCKKKFSNTFCEKKHVVIC